MTINNAPWVIVDRRVDSHVFRRGRKAKTTKQVCELGDNRSNDHEYVGNAGRHHQIPLTYGIWCLHINVEETSKNELLRNDSPYLQDLAQVYNEDTSEVRWIKEIFTPSLILVNSDIKNYIKRDTRPCTMLGIGNRFRKMRNQFIAALTNRNRTFGEMRHCILVKYE